MAKVEDLMGLGVPHFVARLQGRSTVLNSAVGASVGSATQIGGADFNTVVTTGTSSLKVPLVGGDTGCLIGDMFTIMNLTAATIAIYAASNANGSAVTFYTSAASGTSVSCAIGKVATIYPITISSWAVVAGASAA